MNKAFAVAALKSISTVGAVSPSSKFLGRKMTRLLNADVQHVVELGAGTGAITREIVRKAQPYCRIDSFEIDPELYIQLSSSPDMIAQDNIHFHLNSAFDFRSMIGSNSQPDMIISGLPLAILPKQQVMRMLCDCREAMSSNGVFVQFQYSPESLGLLKRVFTNVTLGLEVRNFPPALVYTCNS
jgi:phospholipid N-methyltransferase